MTATISRRTLAKGATWSAPVIVASTLVPSYAASACKPEEFALTTYTRYLNDDFLSHWQITFRGSNGKTISPGDTLVLDFEGLKLSPSSESSWSLSSDGKTATYIGPETSQAVLPFVLDYEPPHPYTNAEELEGLTNAQKTENDKAARQATEKVSSKITDEAFGKNWNFVPANSAKCFEFLGGTVETLTHVVEIDYDGK